MLSIVHTRLFLPLRSLSSALQFSGNRMTLDSTGCVDRNTKNRMFEFWKRFRIRKSSDRTSRGRSTTLEREDVSGLEQQEPFSEFKCEV